MKIKTFKHHSREECNLCNKVIYTEKDFWVSLIDLQGDKIMSTKFYHQSCLNDLIKGKGKLITQNVQDNIMKTVGDVMKKLQPMIQKMQGEEKKDEVYEIKND